MSFIPFFGSALQVPPHLHSLVPDGVFVPREGGVRFEPLPPPTQDEELWLKQQAPARSWWLGFNDQAQEGTWVWLAQQPTWYIH